jgi:hypothetical protein
MPRIHTRSSCGESLPGLDWRHSFTGANLVQLGSSNRADALATELGVPDGKFQMRQECTHAVRYWRMADSLRSYLLPTNHSIERPRLGCGWRSSRPSRTLRLRRLEWIQKDQKMLAARRQGTKCMGTPAQCSFLIRTSGCPVINTIEDARPESVLFAFPFSEQSHLPAHAPWTGLNEKTAGRNPRSGRGGCLP